MPYRKDEILYHLNESRSDHYKHASDKARKIMREQQRPQDTPKRMNGAAKSTAGRTTVSRQAIQEQQKKIRRDAMQKMSATRNTAGTTERYTRKPKKRSRFVWVWILFILVMSLAPAFGDFKDIIQDVVSSKSDSGNTYTDTEELDTYFSAEQDDNGYMFYSLAAGNGPVENFMEISLQTKQQVEEIESTSKYSENENSIISNSNFFVPTGDSFIVEPVSFIISNEGVLVSVRSAEFRTFRETEKRLQMNYRSYSTGYHLFISLLEVRIDFDADLVELIAKQVAALSKDINSENSIDKEVLHRISALQESTMSLRENIFDRQRVLSGILRSERFPNDIYPRLQLMIKDVNSLINHADFSFQRLDYIQDAALGLINIEQNEIVKIFSVAAVIFMPATLIASIYGMNFKFMPELDWTLTLGNGWNIPLGYIFAIGLMIFCSALTIWYFKYKKWL